jgi:hypothetical protein
MYFYILNLCLNTITSIIKTNVFFDLTDFQVPLVVVRGVFEGRELETLHARVR